MFYIVVDFLFIIIGGLDLFMVFIYYVYLFIYLFIYILIRKLYLLEMMVSEIMLLDWLIKLKRSVVSVLFQTVYFTEGSQCQWHGVPCILCILLCSVNLMFTTLLKNQVEYIFLAL